MSLQHFSTDELQRELSRRRECCDCRRSKPFFAEARGWVEAGANRIRCPFCVTDNALHAPKLPFILPQR